MPPAVDNVADDVTTPRDLDLSTYHRGLRSLQGHRSNRVRGRETVASPGLTWPSEQLTKSEPTISSAREYTKSLLTYCDHKIKADRLLTRDTLNVP